MGMLSASALGLLQEMVHQLLTPDLVRYSAAISACEKSKRWEEVFGLLQKMVHTLVTPNLVIPQIIYPPKVVFLGGKPEGLP